MAERQFRLKVGGFPAHTSTGWGWYYEVRDMERPEGCRVVISGIRHDWRGTLEAGAQALRYLEGNRACGFD